MGEIRRRYKPEFKIEAISLLKSSHRPVTEVARDLGINASLLWRWKRELASEADARDGNGQVDSETGEVQRLKRELKFVKEERDTLSKAFAILSKRLGVE